MINSISMKYRKGEIATILAIGAMIIIAVTTFVSSTFINKQKTISKTKAQDYCDTRWYCAGENACDTPGVIATFKSYWATKGVIDENEVAKIWRAEKAKNCNPPINPDTQCSSTTAEQCKQRTTPTGSAAPAGGGVVGNGCFSLSADFEVKQEGTSQAFYATVTFDKGGHNNIYYNGIALTNGVSLTYGPGWTHPPFPGCGIGCEAGIAKFPNDSGLNRVDFTYLGGIEECNPKTVSLNCAVGVNSSGPYVSGNGCSCKNCTKVLTPTTPPTPTTATSGGGKTTTSSTSCNLKNCKDIDKNYNDKIFYRNNIDWYSDSECKKVIPNLTEYCKNTKTAMLTCKLGVQAIKDNKGLKDVKVYIYKGNEGEPKEFVESSITDTLGNAQFVNDFSEGFLTINAVSQGSLLTKYYRVTPPNLCGVQFDFSTATPVSTVPTSFCPNPKIGNFPSGFIRIGYFDKTNHVKWIDFADSLNSEVFKSMLRNKIIEYAKTQKFTKEIYYKFVMENIQWIISSQIKNILKDVNTARIDSVFFLEIDKIPFSFPIGQLGQLSILSYNTIYNVILGNAALNRMINIIDATLICS